jgi:D-alanine-D-alanine ligase
VITGDHTLPDPTKWDGRYSDDDLALHEEMREALEGLPGYAFDFVAEHEGLFERLRLDPPDFVLNLCDTGYRNAATQELHIPALLEMLGIPYSGTGPAGMVLCYDKAVVGLVAASLGVPVPRESYLPPGRGLGAIEAFYPALIKPVEGDGSVGITPESVVRTPADAKRQLARIRSEFPGRAMLWQEYLPGPEYGLALVGNPETEFTAFPPLEVDYSRIPRELPPILAFESKTGPETRYGGLGVRPADLSGAELAELRRSAELLFGRLQCRDYARFDFRTGADGRIKLLEVNPNPAWSSGGKLALMAAYAQTGYAELLGTILDVAVGRRRKVPSHD